MTPPPERVPTPTPGRALELSHPTALGELFELGRGDAFTWTTAERAGLLRHQLDLPLGPAPPDAAVDGWEERPHRALFTEPDPPLARLQFIKTRAKRGVTGAAAGEGAAEELLPRDVATAVYYAALAAARLHHEAPITRLDDVSFRTGLHWALDQPWVGEPLRGLFADTLAALGNHSPDKPGAKT